MIDLSRITDVRDFTQCMIIPAILNSGITSTILRKYCENTLVLPSIWYTYLLPRLLDTFELHLLMGGGHKPVSDGHRL